MYHRCTQKTIITALNEPLYFSHFRDKEQTEVDIVIETMSGDIISIEVKASATLRKQDFQGLEKLKIAAGKNFRMGIILYDGDPTNMFNENIFSAPIGCLWE
jgi:predicted AAA+ superfamily ATPase